MVETRKLTAEEARKEIARVIQTLPIIWDAQLPTNVEEVKYYSPVGYTGEVASWRFFVLRFEPIPRKFCYDGSAVNAERQTVVHLASDLAQMIFEKADAAYNRIV